MGCQRLVLYFLLHSGMLFCVERQSFRDGERRWVVGEYAFGEGEAFFDVKVYEDELCVHHAYCSWGVQGFFLDVATDRLSSKQWLSLHDEQALITNIAGHCGAYGDFTACDRSVFQSIFMIFPRCYRSLCWAIEHFVRHQVLMNSIASQQSRAVSPLSVR